MACNADLQKVGYKFRRPQLFLDSVPVAPDSRDRIRVPAYAPVKRSRKCLSTAIPKDGRAQSTAPGRAYLRIYISIALPL